MDSGRLRPLSSSSVSNVRCSTPSLRPRNKASARCEGIACNAGVCLVDDGVAVVAEGVMELIDADGNVVGLF